MRTQQLCLSIARDYPDSPVAPEAIYRAGCATYRLTAFNGWWSEEGSRTDLMGTAVRLMRRVCRRYPKSPIAAHARKFAAVWGAEREAALEEQRRERREHPEWYSDANRF